MGNHEKDKEGTKRKLIQAIGEVFRTAGYGGLGVNKVARIAGVHKKLIYRYFGSFENLVEAYVVETDYWISFADQLLQVTRQHGSSDIRSLICEVLNSQYDYFKANHEMQQLILWELSSNSALMRSIHRTRELMGQKLFALAEPEISDKPVNFRAVAALMVGGIYYMILHTRFNGGIFSDIDLNSEEGEAAIKKAIRFVVEASF